MLEKQRHALALDASGDWRAALGVLANVEEIKRRAFNGKEGDAHIPQVLHNIGVVYASKGVAFDTAIVTFICYERPSIDNRSRGTLHQRAESRCVFLIENSDSS